ncbi:MAG: hypothetical protein U0790_20165 [Isosphaeraceae bacterium]
MSKLSRRAVAAVLALSCLSGCSIQDSTQPAENSISAGPRSDQALVKAKKGVRPGTAVGKTR